MECPNCGFDNPRDMRFCGMCGIKIAQECPSCHALIPLNFMFCGNCGYKLPELETEDPEAVIAPSTPTNDESSTTRPSQQLTNQVELQKLTHSQLVGKRRLATILIADVKSSTTLMEQLGTEEWVSVMNRILQIMAGEIYRFGGEVDQFRGDGLIAFFGAWSAHEDDPERAVFSGLLMQLSIKKLASELKKEKGIDLSIRIGINTGEVIAGSIGENSHHGEDTVMGGAIALAARLESLAEPGTVLVSEETYRLTVLQFKWESLGEITIRGISNPIAAYRPLEPLSESEQEHRLQEYGLSIPLIGREDEIKSIENVIYDLRNGVGGIIMVSGMAGLGKSRLLTEVQQSIKREEALSTEDRLKITWLRGRCRSYDHSLPHSMWIDTLYHWVGMHELATQKELLERLQQKSWDLWGDQYTEYYPYLAKFLSLPLEKSFPDWIEHLEAEGLRHQFFHVIQSWVEALAKRSPTVIIFSEAHWADEASLALLKHCLPLCDRVPILWMVVYRPDPDALTWSFNHFIETEYPHRLTTIDLTSLSKSDSNQLLDKLIDINVIPEEMRNAIIDKSEGNPYYLTEIVRSLVDRKVIVRSGDDGRWQVAMTDAPLDLPNTLIGLLSARIMSLSLAEQRVLQLAAVIGTVFWVKLLQVLIDEEEIHIEDHLTSLQRARLIRERSSSTELGTEYVFLSALIRDAAYESLLTSSRAKYHLIAAEFLETYIGEQVLHQYHGVIAYHYHQAGVCQKEIDHTLLAANNAKRVYANAEAVHQYNLALKVLERIEDCADPPPQHLNNKWRLEALTGLGQTYFGIGEITQAEHYLRQAVSLGREIGIEPMALTRLFYWLGEVLFWQNQYEEPIHLGEEGLYYLGENNKNIEAALMNQLIAIGCSQLGDHEKFIDFTQRTANFIQDLPYTEELRPAYDHIIGLYAYTLKNVQEAERWLDVFKHHAEEHYDLRALGEFYNNKAFISAKQGDLNSAILFYKQGIEHFNQIGDDKHACRALRGLSVCYLKKGDLENAEENIISSLEKAKIIDNPIDVSLGYWFLAQIQLCKGWGEKAAQTFLKSKEFAQGIPVIRGGWAFLGFGQVHFSHANALDILGNHQANLENDPNLLYQNPYLVTTILSNLERSYKDPIDYQAYVEDFKQRHPELNHADFQQWYLTPEQIFREEDEPLIQELFESTLTNPWRWVDTYKDCSYTIDHGLTINAANERNFHHINRSAPRMVYSIPLKGDFTLQTKCQPCPDEKPAIGGLLVWQNEKNWLCLEIGARGEDEVIFRGFKDNHDTVFGRGRLLQAGTAHLRLEKHGYQVTAFCSKDSKNWFFVGNTHIPSSEPVFPGIHANGHINRLIYPGAFPQGTSIVFRQFSLWAKG